MESMQLKLPNMKLEIHAKEVKNLIREMDESAMIEMVLDQRIVNISGIDDDEIRQIIAMLTEQGYWTESVTNLVTKEKVIARCMHSPYCRCDCNG